MHSPKGLLGDASHFCLLFTYCEGLKLKCDRYSSMAFNFRNNSPNRLTLKVSLVPKQYSNLTCDKRCMKPSHSCSCVHENVNVKNMHMDLKTLTWRFLRSLKTSGPLGSTACLVGIDPVTKLFFTLNPMLLARLFSKQLDSKWAEHNEEYWLIGSPKSTRCRWTNLIHWALHFGSVGNRCIVMPGV